MDIRLTMVVCPHCNRWVILEGHEHEQTIIEVWRVDRALRKIMGHGYSMPCRLVAVANEEDD